MSLVDVLGKRIPSRGHSKCKGPGVGTYMICSRRKKEARVDLLVCVCVCLIIKAKSAHGKIKK